MKNRIYQTAFIKADHLRARFLRFNGASQTGRPRADDDDIGPHLGTRLHLRLWQGVWNLFGRQMDCPESDKYQFVGLTILACTAAELPALETTFIDLNF